jgi:ribosomal protein L25 (general stress protein Ctc)
MIDFIRSLFESALKTNPYLEFAALTGCLRISRESIFTGLNNLNIVSILTKDYSEYFGFTQEEVEAMLRYYNLESKIAEAKRWYNGYSFGNSEVYNPWSTIKVVADWNSGEKFPKPHWSNTSSNSIVRTLIDKADNAAKADLDTLVEGGTIRKAIHEDITYDEMENSIDNIWNFLFFTGYLTKAGEHFEGRNIIIDLKVPNEELQYIFSEKITDWFKEKINQKDFSKLYTAILEGDSEVFENELSTQLLDSISFYDSAENFYHGFLTGLLLGVKGYLVKSNRESGNGRSDVFLRDRDLRGKAVIFELKIADSIDDLPQKCDDALTQIEEKKYETELRAEGYKNILKYGVAFYKKNCMVKVYRKNAP